MPGPPPEVRQPTGDRETWEPRIDARLKRKRSAIFQKGYNVAGMSMPHSENLVVETRKLTEYLLSPQPQGKAQGRLLPAVWVHHCKHDRVCRSTQGARSDPAGHPDYRYPHGRRYNVEGPLRSPDGRNPQVRTVWQLEPGSKSPTLLNAFRKRR